MKYKKGDVVIHTTKKVDGTQHSVSGIIAYVEKYRLPHSEKKDYWYKVDINETSVSGFIGDRLMSPSHYRELRLKGLLK